MGDVYTNPPQSRNEAILNSIVEGTQYTDPPQSRIEDLLLEVKQVIEEGGHDESATRASIAPTESDSAHASKNIVVGEQFYLSDDKLYTATSSISQGSAIVVYPTENYNCRVSDSVTSQILDKVDRSVYNAMGAKNLYYTSKTMTFVKSSTRTGYGVSSAYAISGSRLKVVFKVTNIENFTLTSNSFGVRPENIDSHEPLASAQYLPTNSTGTYAFEFTLSSAAISTQKVRFYWFIASGEASTATITIDDIMVVIPDETDLSYQPYANSNRGLTLDKADNSVIGTVEDGATCANPNGYAIGEHFLRGGKFCTAIASIASGASFTLNTNYIEGSVGDIVYLNLKQSEVAITSGSTVTVDFDSLVPFANYEVLNANVMVRGTGQGYASYIWTYATAHTLHMVIRNNHTDDVLWTLYCYVTLRIK